MEIATIINVHKNPESARDIIDSVRVWTTNKILLIVDKVGWRYFEKFNHPDTVVRCGVVHNARRSPYKNMAIGLKEAYKLWPKVDWYNYFEYDALYLNDNFKKDLQLHQIKGTSAVGFNHVIKYGSNDHWIVKKILGESHNQQIFCNKLLGAVTFYSNHAISKLSNLCFFDELLELTKDYHRGYLPSFNEYAVEEIVFPSAASIFGPVGNLNINRTPRYKVNFAPEVRPNEITGEISIIHPIKEADGVIHKHYRKVREFFLKDK